MKTQSDNMTITFRSIAIISIVLLTIVHNYLFYGLGIGINIIVFNALLLPTIIYVGYLRRGKISTLHGFIGIMVLVLSGFIGLRDNLAMLVLNTLSIFGLLLLLLMSYLPAGLKNATFYSLCIEYIKLPIKLFLSLFNLNKREDMPVKKPSQVRRLKDKKINPAALRGILITAPIIFVLILLLSSADSVFAELFSFSLPRIEINTELVARLLYGLFVFTIFVSGMRYLLDSREDVLEKDIEFKGSARIEVGILLGSIVAVIGIFIAIQIIYLFGGADVVLDGTLSYAEYARKGFFELLTVAAIVYGVLATSDHFLKKGEKKVSHFKFIQLFLIFEVYILIASAIKRLNLYQDTFGLTSSRFFSYIIMLSLAVMFCFLAIKIAYNKSAQWLLKAYGLVVVGTLLVINFSNIDSFVAKTNIDRYQETGKIDEQYLLGLSNDAINEKVRYVSLKIEKESDTIDAFEFCRLLDCDGVGTQAFDWRSTNVSTEHYKNIITDHLNSR